MTSTRIVYDMRSMQYISIFEKLTRAKVKDCFYDDVQERILFIVQPGQLRIALGKQGANAKRLEEKLKKKIKIVEFHPKLTSFVRNMCYPLRVKDVRISEEDPDIIVIEGGDQKTNGLLIGRAAQNLRNLEKNIRRYFEVKEIKVV